MCDRLSSDNEGRRVGGGDEDHLPQKKDITCHNCSMNRHQSEEMRFDTSPVSTSEVRRSRNDAISVNYNNNKITNNKNKTSDSIKKSLLRLGTHSRKLITNPSLIIVLIVILANCPRLVKAKPVAHKSPSSRQQHQLGGGILSSVGVPKNIISPDVWFAVESRKRELSPATLKMERLAKFEKEAHDTFVDAISAMEYHLKLYIENVMQEKSRQEFDSDWSEHIKKFDWMGRTKLFDKNIKSDQYLEELMQLHERFQKIAQGINMIRDHNEQSGPKDRSERLKTAYNAGESAGKHVNDVLSSLAVYYKELNKNDWELNDIPAVTDDVIPNRDYSQDNRMIHHYVILREFLDHLAFSKDVVHSFHSNEVQPKKSSSNGGRVQTNGVHTSEVAAN